MKEKLVVEMFKDRIREHYYKTLRTGVQCDSKPSNVFTEIREYSYKVGADYNKVQQLCYKIKEELYREHDNKFFRDMGFPKGTISGKAIAHRNIVRRQNFDSKKIIRRNGGVV